MAHDTFWTISESSTGSGSCDPVGDTMILDGGSQSYTITPAAGWFIFDVRVDGVSQGAITNYLFSNVTSDHTIFASFRPIYVVTVNVTGSGTVSPGTTNNVNSGSNLTLTFTPSAAHFVTSLVLDGVRRPVATSLALLAVSQNHTVDVVFNTHSGTTVYDKLSDGTTLKEINVVGDEGLARYKPKQYSAPPPEPPQTYWRSGRRNLPPGTTR
jgi:hypothetical protein